MIRLQQIIETIGPESVIGFRENTLTGVACHPASVKGPGFLFACIDEYLEYNRWQTRRTHLETLPHLALGAVLTSRPIEGLHVPQLVCRKPRTALGLAARLFHACPDQRLKVYGITGTNGKTTTTRILAHLLSGLGISTGCLGTLGTSIDGRELQPGTYTTPLSPDLYAQLAMLEKAGARAVAMEVSSHALALDRVAGITFDGAILTNIARDHLDFHGTPEAYALAKEQLFRRVKPDGPCLLNRHSPHFEPFSRIATGPVTSYGFSDSGAGISADPITLQADKSRFRVTASGESALIETRLAGRFQVENALAAIALAHQLGYPLSGIAEVVAGFPPVCGRMEQVPLSNGATAIVDYAHNPDGLSNLLTACRTLCRGRLHVVFGCGGDRDRGKRPLMGAIAAELADVCWVTSDNPRTEDPESIIEDILQGMTGSKGAPNRIPDRKAAIKAAFLATKAGDILVVAGKGHEDYQIIGFTKHAFSDQAVLRGLATNNA